MWTKLKNNIAIIPKAYDIRADNVLVLETDKLYFFIPLRELTGDPWNTYHYKTFIDEESHPLAFFERFKIRLTGDDGHSFRQFMIVNGERRDEWLCCICKHKFLGLTNGCVWDGHAADKRCQPDFDILPELPVLQVKGGAYVPPKYFNTNFKPYYRDKDLSDYGFGIDIVDKAING